MTHKRITTLRPCPECGVHFTLNARCKFCAAKRKAAYSAARGTARVGG